MKRLILCSIAWIIFFFMTMMFFASCSFSDSKRHLDTNQADSTFLEPVELVNLETVELAKDEKLQKEALSMNQLALISFEYMNNEYSGGEDPKYVDNPVNSRIDFRKNNYFKEMVRRVVTSDTDFKTMLNSEVLSTEYGSMAMERIDVFNLKGSSYSIYISQYISGEMSVTISINGHEYEWTDPEYEKALSYYTAESSL